MLAAERILIAPGAFVMIHQPWSLAAGDAREMRKAADLLDQVALAIRADYARRTKLAPAKIAAMMDAETWLEADEAVAQGFADEIIEKPVRSDARAFDLSAYGRTPAALKARPGDEGELVDLEAARWRQRARLRFCQ